jgi:hypothetical protein
MATKLLDLSLDSGDLGDCTSGDLVEFINDGRLFVVQGFADGNAVLAHIDRYNLCYVHGLRAIDNILENLISDYDIAPISFCNFRRVVYCTAA